jgi:ankyrin repeat protein
MTPIPITLRDAAAQNDAATVKQLLQGGALINEFDGAALRAALRHEHPDIVRILVEAGADCQSNSDEFMSEALSNGDAVSLQLLINHLKKTPPIEWFSLYCYFDIAIRSCSAESVRITLFLNS